MFVHLLWFCSTPNEPHGKKRVAIFRSNFRDLPIGAEQKLKPEIGHLFSQTHHSFIKYPSC